MLLTADLMTSPGVVLHTNQGDIDIDLYAADTPITVDNFLNYVNDGDYDNAFFHRSVSDFIVQTGGYSTNQALVNGSVPLAIPTDDAIQNEPGISNVRATVAMAKVGGDPDSATSQFFVNLADNSSNLDDQNGGFTVFGTVADMTASDAIAALDVYNFSSTFNEVPISGSEPNLSLVVIESVSGDGEIRGTLFEDTDRDGVQDGGETAVVGGMLFVDANDDGILDVGEVTTTTAADGSYTFTVAGRQTHVVRQVVPTGTEATIGNGRLEVDVEIGRFVAENHFGQVDLPTVEVITSDAVATEEGLQSGSFTITVTGAANSVEVFYSLSGSATSGVDYTAVPGSLLVDGSGILSISPIDDSQYNEGTENVVLTLSTAVESYILGTSTVATLEITDNDVASVATDSTTLYETAVDTTLDVLSNDTLPSGVAITSVTTPDQAGTALIANAGQSVTYNPPGGYRGEETFSYTVTLPDASELTASVSVNIVADLPSAAADLFAADEDSIDNSLTVLANDFLASGTADLLSIFSTTTPSAGGTVTIAGDGLSLLYTPVANFSGDETFSYTIEGPVGDTATAEVTVTVAWAADPPEVADDTFTLAEDSPQTSLAVLTNDALPAGESGTLVISSFGTPSAGGSVSNTGAALLYTPAADFSGTETVSYTVTAPDGGTATATATITVTPVADAPILADDTVTLAEDSSESSLAVLTNDVLPAGESGTLVISSFGTPSAGGSVSNTGAALLYTPAADFSGTETIDYTVTAPDGGTATATATITVTPVADAPILADDTVTLAEDSSESTLAVLTNDALPAGESGTLVISSVGTPSAGGSVSNTGAALLYTPAADFSGTETVSYTVTAPDGGTATATATITVTPVADAPILADDTVTLAEDSSESSLAVLTNDALPAGESGTLVISSFGTPSAGGSVSNTGAALLYTPAADFSGTETIDYTVTAPDGGTATATATITVTPVADAPILADDTVTLAEDSSESSLAVLTNDALPAGESGTLVISSFGTPSAGGSVSNTGAALLYTPAADFSGTETVSYTVTAPDGGTATATATITVTPVADAPILADDTFTLAEDSSESTLAVLTNDALPAGESGTLVISSVGTPSAGGSVSNTGAALLYTPAADFSGTETIAYTVTAPDGGTATATATIEVFSYTASIDAGDPSGETGGGVDQIGGMTFAFAEIDSGGGDFSAIYATAAIENVAALLPGFEAEVVDGTSGQVWDLDFSSSFSGEVQLILRYNPSLVDIANFGLAHVHDSATQLLTAMPAGSSGPALLNQYIVDETLGQIQVTLDQFSGLVLFNQQLSSDPSTLAGLVFLDQNGNGQLDSGEGEVAVGGVEILLTGPAGTAQTTYTAADGSYLFENLVEGDYTITEDPSGTLRQVFADGADSVGSQGGTVDDANDQIVISDLAPESSGQNNLHAEGNLQTGFISRRDFLSRTPQTEFVAIVQPGAARAIAYTLQSGWEGIDSAEIQLSEDRTELEVRITENAVTEAVVLDATDPAQVWFRGRRDDTYMLGIVGSRSDWAFAPVAGGSSSGTSEDAPLGTSSLFGDDAIDSFLPEGDGASETETVDALFGELGSELGSGETLS